MRRAADADALVCHDIESRACIKDEAVAPIGAEIHLMISTGNRQRLCEFSRTRAKLTEIVKAAAALHQFDPPPWFQRANQNKTVRVAFDEHV